MAFTGRLGTSNSQLGNIVLGTAATSGTSGSGSLTVHAVLLATQSGAWGIDASVFVPPSSFVVDALLVTTQVGSWGISAETILPYSTTQHHREHDHFGTQNDTVIVYNGQTLDVVLLAIYDDIEDLT